MSITLKPYLLKRRKKVNGLTPVYIRITKNRRYSLLSTGIDIQAKYWRDKATYGNWIKSGKYGHASADMLNSKIKSILNRLHQIIEEGGEHITRRQVVKLYRGREKGEFMSHALEFAKRKQQEGKYDSYKQVKAAASKLTEFASEDIRFGEITPQLLNRFQRWMSRELDNHPNTIVKTMNRVKAIMDDAYRHDLTTNLPFADPKFEKVKSVKSKKEALSIEQITTIESLALKPESDLWHVRNYFLFSFWNAGIRFTDLAFLRWENIKDGRLVYQMGKNGKTKNIKLLDEAKQILRPYRTKLDEKYRSLLQEGDISKAAIEKMKRREFIFPLLPDPNMSEFELKKKASSQNVLVNRSLKKIQDKAGIDTNISFHIARHSFARWADRSGVMDRKQLMNALAHSKMDTTEQYLDSISEYNLDESMQALANQRR